MKLSFSPTTALGYVQVAATAAIIGHPLYLYWTVTNYDAVAGLTGATAMSVAVNSIIALVKSHFTADTPSIPKPDQNTTINP